MAFPYIFGIGAPKTGSNSLVLALQQLGFNAIHLGSAAYNLESQWLKLVQKNVKAGLCPVESFDCDAVADWPIHEHYKELDTSIPHAKFILTYRPPHDCALSWVRMTSIQHKKFAPHFKAKAAPHYTSYSNRVEYVTKHVDNVLRYFWGRPQKLLILDARDADAVKWSLLTEFLDRPPVDKSVLYPHEFDHAKKQISPFEDLEKELAAQQGDKNE